MSINFRAPEMKELKPRITVLGVGGAGGNAVNNMISAKLEGVSFVVANTDAQALAQSKAEHKIQLGTKLTEGLGAGAKPEVGRGAAEESLDEILQHLSGAHMVFITAGMGGGTGTGAAPVIARAVREQGVLTVGVITKPFHFEGDKRMKVAERGIEELQTYVDTLIIIPNQNLFRVANERTTFAQAFAMADDVLHSGVRGVTDLIVMPGLINRDFADIKTVMSEMGKAMMGTGEMAGDGRALKAAEAAISNPLLDEVSMKGARAVLVNVTGGPDLMLFEVDEAVNRIRAEVDPDANILFGSALSEQMEGRVRVSVVATGIDGADTSARLGDNVQRLPMRRKAPEIETPPLQPHATVRANPETRIEIPVRQQMANLVQELAPLVQELSPLTDMPLPPEPALPYASPHPTAQFEEPMRLGGVESPALDDLPPQNQGLRGFGPQQLRKEKEKRRGFGLFGTRRRDERSERMEPPLETPRAQAIAQPIRNQAAAVAQPIRQPVSQAAPVSMAQAVQIPAQPVSQLATARNIAPQPEIKDSAADLFAGVAEDDRFEIPAFLRRQGKMGP